MRPRSAGVVQTGGKPLRVVALLYGARSYGAFLGVFLYLVGFVVDVAVPRSVDHAINARLSARW